MKKLAFFPSGVQVCFAGVLVAAFPVLSVARAHGQGKDQDNNGVVLKTPSGGFEVSGKVKASEIGLPVYPGAKQVPESDKNSGNLTFSLSRQGKPDTHFLVAKVETPDSIDQVRDFYKKKLGPEVAKFTEKDKDGNMVFEIRKGDRQRRYVQIKSDRGRTEIDLVRIDGVTFSGDDEIEIK